MKYTHNYMKIFLDTTKFCIRKYFQTEIGRCVTINTYHEK